MTIKIIEESFEERKKRLEKKKHEIPDEQLEKWK